MKEEEILSKLIPDLKEKYTKDAKLSSDKRARLVDIIQALEAYNNTKWPSISPAYQPTSRRSQTTSQSVMKW